MQIVLSVFMAALPGIAALFWLTAQAVSQKKAKKRIEQQKAATAAAWVRQQKEFANFFAYDGTTQED